MSVSVDLDVFFAERCLGDELSAFGGFSRAKANNCGLLGDVLGRGGWEIIRE